MPGDLVVRQETRSDIAGIRATHVPRLREDLLLDGTEAEIIDRLRSAGGLALSLVALTSGELAGHAGVSRRRLPHGIRTGGLRLPARYPSRQISSGTETGKRLIAEGLSRLQASGGKGCILVGDPTYYRQSGFTLAPQACPPTQPQEYFMIRILGEDQPCGQFEFMQGSTGT